MDHSVKEWQIIDKFYRFFTANNAILTSISVITFILDVVSMSICSKQIEQGRWQKRWSYLNISF